MRKPKWVFKFYKKIFNWNLLYQKNELLWKDKFGSPRCEKEPGFKIEWFWFGIYGVQEDDNYWEQWLWLNKFGGTKETWPWTYYGSKRTTWKEYK